MPRRVLVTTLILASVASLAIAQGPGPWPEDRSPSYFKLGGSADWELYRSTGDSQGTRAIFDEFRQRYSLDASGVIWDPRFSRYALGVDLFRADRKVDGQSSRSSTLGYRGTATFFPARPFPLTIFARRANTDSSGGSLSDSGRETAAWGAEWSASTSLQQKLRAQFDKASFDLLSPVELRERRTHGGLEFSQQFERSEISARYGLSDERELVRDARFRRQDVSVEERNRLPGGATFLFNGTRGLSDAVFSTGDRDRLTIDRVSGVLDLPRANRRGVNLSYEFDRNDGKFVDSTSHNLRFLTRVPIGESWESSTNATVGRLATASGATEIRQDVTGVGASLRYNHDWDRFHLGGNGALGVSRTSFNPGAERTALNGSLDLDARAPFAGEREVFASAAYRRDQNDVTGVGYSLDEARGSLGFESGPGDPLKWRGSAYVRGTKYDTFQFGVQTSKEIGAEGSLGGAHGGATFGGSQRKGISQFIPDPAAGSPFLPGSDLVQRSRSVFAGAYWKFLRRLDVRAEVRLDDREFTTLGKERVFSYHPEVGWNWGVWRSSFVLSHYERSNHVRFSQDTMLVKLTRVFF